MKALSEESLGLYRSRNVPGVAANAAGRTRWP